MIWIHNGFAIGHSCVLLLCSITYHDQFDASAFEIQGKAKIAIKPKGPNLAVTWT